jgi:hypothetical protein
MPRARPNAGVVWKLPWHDQALPAEKKQSDAQLQRVRRAFFSARLLSETAPRTASAESFKRNNGKK